MKKALRLLLILPAALLLAACGQSYNNAPATGGNVPSAVNTMPEPGGEVPPIAPGEEMAEAANYKKVSCADIGNKEKQQQCEKTVNDVIANLIRTEAVSDYNLSLCDKLPDMQKAGCKSAIEATGIKGPVPAEEKQKFNEAMAPSYPQSGIEEGGEEEPGPPPAYRKPVYDTSKCAGLKTPGYKEYCEKQVAELQERELLREIISSQDKNRCDELTSEQFKQACANRFGIPYQAPEMEEPPMPEPVMEEAVE